MRFEGLYDWFQVWGFFASLFAFSAPFRGLIALCIEYFVVHSQKSELLQNRVIM